MDKTQALQFIYELAKTADLPKGININDSISYINQIEKAKEILTSCIADKPKEDIE